MLSQTNSLVIATDGRYASNLELDFLEEYIESYAVRLRAYQKLCSDERTIVQDVCDKVRAINSNFLVQGNVDISAKCKQDTIRVLRYSVAALLLNDPHMLQEKLLFWFQTVMRAFGTERSCEITYIVMQEVIQNYLTAEEVKLFSPILELNRTTLGLTAV
jgi:hypothetical protein